MNQIIILIASGALKHPLMFPGLIGGKSPPREGSPRSAKIKNMIMKGIPFFPFFLIIIFLLSSPRPDQDVDEPPSKRLTEPADVLRMPVSYHSCIWVTFSLFILLRFSLSSFSHFACRHWKASSTPVLLRSRKPTLTLSSKGDESHLHSLQGSPFQLPASLISQVSCDVHPNIVLFEIMQCHV